MRAPSLLQEHFVAHVSEAPRLAEGAHHPDAAATPHTLFGPGGLTPKRAWWQQHTVVVCLVASAHAEIWQSLRLDFVITASSVQDGAASEGRPASERLAPRWILQRHLLGCSSPRLSCSTQRRPASACSRARLSDRRPLAGSLARFTRKSEPTTSMRRPSSTTARRSMSWIVMANGTEWTSSPAPR